MAKEFWINLPWRDLRSARGWMYGAGFVDVDGHQWNVLYMDGRQ